MVATDVASRGIGMIDRRSALPLSLLLLTSCGSYCLAMLSVDVCSASATIWSRLMTAFGFLAKSTWQIRCSVACYILIPSLIYRKGIEADGTLLDLFKLHS